MLPAMFELGPKRRGLVFFWLGIGVSEKKGTQEGRNVWEEEAVSLYRGST